MGKIRLSDAIRELREELTRARDAAVGEPLAFDVDSIELEIAVTAESEAGVEGKVNWWVFSGGASGKAADAHSQTITLTLSPKDAGGRPLQVSQDELERAGAPTAARVPRDE